MCGVDLQVLGSEILFCGVDDEAMDRLLSAARACPAFILYPDPRAFPVAELAHHLSRPPSALPPPAPPAILGGAANRPRPVKLGGVLAWMGLDRPVQAILAAVGWLGLSLASGAQATTDQPCGAATLPPSGAADCGSVSSRAGGVGGAPGDRKGPVCGEAEMGIREDDWWDATLIVLDGTWSQVPPPHTGDAEGVFEMVQGVGLCEGALWDVWGGDETGEKSRGSRFRRSPVRAHPTRREPHSQGCEMKTPWRGWEGGVRGGRKGGWEGERARGECPG